MIHAISYVSSADSQTTSESVKSLMRQSQEFNLKHQITGVFLFRDGNFLQLMEGPKDAVRSLYEKIEQDTRHHHIIKIVETTYEDRIFDSFGEGFSLIDDSYQISELVNYLDWIKRHPSFSISNFVLSLEKFVSQY